MGADPVSELSSLDEADESDEEADPAAAAAAPAIDSRTTNSDNNSNIDRWNRVRELAAQLVTNAGPVRVRQKISILNAIAQHVAAAENAAPEAIFHELCNIYTRCALELPDRHKPLMISPIQTLKFALRERSVPSWFSESLEALQKSVSGDEHPPENKVQITHPENSGRDLMQSSTSFPAQIGEEILDLEDFSIPKSVVNLNPTVAPIAQEWNSRISNSQENYDAISGEAKLSYLNSCGISTNLYTVMANIQSGKIPFNEQASNFLQEVAWMESVQSWQDWNADRAYKLAQLANTLNSISINHPAPTSGLTILPPPEKTRIESSSDYSSGVNARKVRRLDGRPFQTASGVMVVHPVARAPLGGGGAAPGSRHAGVVGTMWDDPIIRKLIRMDEVQLLYDLREFCLENSQNFNRCLPRLEGGGASLDVGGGFGGGLIDLASNFPIHATGSKFSATQDLMCSLCGLVLQNQIVKRTHLKSHLIRQCSVLPFLLGVTNLPTPAPPPLRSWLEGQTRAEGSLPSPFSRTRVIADILDQLMSTDTRWGAGGAERAGGDENAATLFRRIPLTNTNLACSLLKNYHSPFACIVCNGVLRPLQIDGLWTIPNVLVGQLQGGTTLKLSLLQPLSGGVSQTRRKDLESIVAGPRNCEFRRVIGRAYTAARDRNEQCPDKLKSFLSRLMRAIGGDVSALQVLVQAFSREAQRKILQVASDEGDDAGAMLKGCLRAFEYYLDRFTASQTGGAGGCCDEEDNLDQSHDTGGGTNGGGGGGTVSSAESPPNSSNLQNPSDLQNPKIGGETAAPGSILIPLNMANAELLHSRFGQGQLLLHTSCASPFVTTTT